MAAPRTLYLIRHAIAYERGPKWPDDTKRPLTRVGIAKMRRAATGIVAAGVKVDLVLSSPLVRARQTAEIVAGAFKRPPKIVEAKELAPDQSAETVAKLLASHRQHTPARARRSRTRSRSTGGVAHRRAAADSVQEGRSRPD